MTIAINQESIGNVWIESVKAVLQYGELHFDEDVSIL